MKTQAFSKYLQKLQNSRIVQISASRTNRGKSEIKCLKKPTYEELEDKVPGLEHCERQLSIANKMR